MSVRVAAALLLLAGLAAGPAAAATRDYPVRGFDRVEVAGPYAVDIVTGGRPSARADGSDAGLDRLVVEVRDRTLYIGTKRQDGWRWLDWRNGGKVAVHVVAPPLVATKLTGSGDVHLDRAAGPAFAVGVTGSGTLDVARVDAGRLAVSVTGSGNARLVGHAADVGATVTGSGDLRGQGLVTEQATVGVTGSGGVRLAVRHAATISLTGSGNVTIDGTARCTIAKRGSGTVRCPG